MKRMLAISLMLFSLVGLAFGQTSTSGGKKGGGVQTFDVAVQVNVSGFSYFMDGKAVGGNVAKVGLGSHEVRVSAPGYVDFSQKINVTGNMSLSVNLQPMMVSLTVAVNVASFSLFVDNVAIKGNSTQVSPGNHNVKVQAPGYLPFETQVNVSQSMTLNVSLQQELFSLTVAVNVSSFSLFVDGKEIKGNTTQVTGGNHSVKVQAPGYLPFESQVNVSQSMTLNVSLQQQLFALTVVVNVSGYSFFVDGQAVAGNMVQVTPGNHQVQVQAPGYMTYAQTVSVSQAMTLNVNLQPITGGVTVNLPDFKDSKGNRLGTADVFIDGKAVKVNAKSDLSPGQHTVKVSIFGMSAEMMIMVEAGKDIVIEPFLQLKLK